MSLTTSNTATTRPQSASTVQDKLLSSGLMLGMSEPANPSFNEPVRWLDLPEAPQWVDLPSPDKPTGLRCSHPADLLVVWRDGADLLIATPRTRVRVTGHFLGHQGGVVCLMANDQRVERDTLALLCIAAERYARARRVPLRGIDDFLHEDDLIRLYATTWPPRAGQGAVRGQ